MHRGQRITLSRVIDGDTIAALTNGGWFQQPGSQRIRLYGIDAPEMDQPGGGEAARHLQQLLGGRRTLWLETRDTDRYGRTVGLLWPRPGRLQDSYNYRMVRDGQARAYMLQGPADRAVFTQAEQEARRQRRGIWKREKTARTAPWEHRQRRPAGKASPGCLVPLIAAGLLGLFLALIALAYLNIN